MLKCVSFIALLYVAQCVRFWIRFGLELDSECYMIQQVLPQAEDGTNTI